MCLCCVDSCMVHSLFESCTHNVIFQCACVESTATHTTGKCLHDSVKFARRLAPPCHGTWFIRRASLACPCLVPASCLCCVAVFCVLCVSHLLVLAFYLLRMRLVLIRILFQSRAHFIRMFASLSVCSHALTCVTACSYLSVCVHMCL